MEAALKKMDGHTACDPDLNKAEYWEFRLHFQQSILLSLLLSGKLTQIQYESCTEKLKRKYITSSPNYCQQIEKYGKIK